MKHLGLEINDSIAFGNILKSILLLFSSIKLRNSCDGTLPLFLTPSNVEQILLKSSSKKLIVSLIFKQISSNCESITSLILYTCPTIGKYFSASLGKLRIFSDTHGFLIDL